MYTTRSPCHESGRAHAFQLDHELQTRVADDHMGHTKNQKHKKSGVSLFGHVKETTFGSTDSAYILKLRITDTKKQNQVVKMVAGISEGVGR